MVICAVVHVLPGFRPFVKGRFQGQDLQINIGEILEQSPPKGIAVRTAVKIRQGVVEHVHTPSRHRRGGGNTVILTPFRKRRDGGEVFGKIVGVHRFAAGDQGPALAQDHAVVAHFAQRHLGGGLHPEEEIPARELIRHIIGDIGGISAVQQTIDGKGWNLRQILILRFGEFPVGDRPKEDGHEKKQSGKEDHKGPIQFFCSLAAAHLDSKKPCRFAVTFRCFHTLPLPQCGTQSPPPLLL